MFNNSKRICFRWISTFSRAKDNEYWNECVAVISKDNHLNKAHVKYMENKFYLLAKEISRFYIVNSMVPTCSSVSEYDIAMLDEFIEHTRLLVNTLGKKVFEAVIDMTSPKLNEDDLFQIKAARGADAKGIIVSEGFAVLKGSVIASTTTPSMSRSLNALRDKLLKDAIINENYEFVSDYIFTSPSLAAAIVMGRNANGKTEWKNHDGENINDIETT